MTLARPKEGQIDSLSQGESLLNNDLRLFVFICSLSSLCISTIRIMPLSNKRKASTGDNDGPSPKRKAGNHITRRATSSSLPQPLEKLDEDIEPVASQSSAGSEYAARDILQENATKYLIDWEDNPVTGERYNPTWVSKFHIRCCCKCLNRRQIDDKIHSYK